jgi:hypothetical protein
MSHLPATAREDAKTLADRFYGYISSAEGEAEMQRHAEESERLRAKLGETRRISQELLHAPFTI